MKRLIAAAAIAAGAFLASAMPGHAQYCEGTVHSLKGAYNLAKGTGFLAVRAAPSAGATMLGELFNGDKVEIFERRGNWYRITTSNGVEGWSHRRWMRNTCPY